MNPTDSRTFDNLALLYQGLLTSIVRIRSGAQSVGDYQAFRRQTRDVLAGIEREAVRSGYPQSDVRNTSYAVVAFLDESILDSADPNRYNWTSLQAELYGQSVAGEGFYQQLDGFRNRRDSQQLMDILEVYYLCLLLGYRGRYAGYAREQAVELNRYRDELRARIEGVRGRNVLFWPGEGPGLPDLPSGPSPEDSAHRRMRTWALVSAVSVVLVWGLCRAALYWQASSVLASLLP